MALDGPHDEVSVHPFAFSDVLFGVDDVDDLEGVVGAAVDPVPGQPVRLGRGERAEVVPVDVDQAEAKHAPTVPWHFSVAPTEGEPAVPNLPTPEGRLLGSALARIADVAEIEALARFPRHHPRCDDCALRSGTLPNGCTETLFDVIKCVVEVVPFFCHKGVRDGKPRHLCAGFALLAGHDDTRDLLGQMIEQVA